MNELMQMEELFKSGVNRTAIKAYLRNAAIMRDPAATPEMKELAAANVKAISNNQPLPKAKAPKQAKQKAAAAEQASQPVNSPSTQTPAAAAPSSNPAVEFHQEFAQHHGVDPVKFATTWKAMTPEQQKITQDWHAEQLAAKPAATPSAAPAVKPAAPAAAPVAAPQPIKVVNNAVTPAASQPHKMAKSVDALYDLFAELKKRL